MTLDDKIANAEYMLQLARGVKGQYPWANELIILLEEEIEAFLSGDEELGHFINREVIKYTTDRLEILAGLQKGLEGNRRMLIEGEEWWQ